MSFKEVSRNAAALFFKRHATEGESGYPPKADKYIFITKNSVPRGYIAVQGQKRGLKINSIFVRPEDRREGYGSRLMGYVSNYTVDVFVESCKDSEVFFNSCGMEADLFGECKDPAKRILSK